MFRGQALSRAVSDDVNEHSTCTGAVELGQEDALPGAKREAPALDREGGGLADEGCHDVGGRIALRVAERAGLWDSLVEPVEHVGRDVRVGVLVDDDAGGGVRDEDVANAGGDTLALDGSVNLCGDFAQLVARTGSHTEAFNAHWMDYRGRYDVVEMVNLVALTIAGSDPSGGAGIQADLKTFSALGVYGMAVITALTAQNTVAVTGVEEVSTAFIGLQIDTVYDDIRPDAVKTGMLANAEVIRLVAAKAWERSFRNLVVDPVMVAKSGDRLLREDAITVLREELIPHAFVLTPNLPEAGDILGRDIRDVSGMRKAARELQAMGAANVVVKGGHLEGDEVVDVLYDGREFHEFKGPRIPTTSTHGTGCTFASAIAASLARGEGVSDAVRTARAYLEGALRNVYPIGHGHGPVHHFWDTWPSRAS